MTGGLSSAEQRIHELAYTLGAVEAVLRSEYGTDQQRVCRALAVLDQHATDQEQETP